MCLILYIRNINFHRYFFCLNSFTSPSSERERESNDADADDRQWANVGPMLTNTCWLLHVGPTLGHPAAANADSPTLSPHWPNACLLSGQLSGGVTRSHLLAVSVMA